MATITIMTPYEVLRHNKFEDIAGCDLNDILQVEQSRFRKFLGSAFRAALLNDMVDYSNTDAYVSGQTYAINENVIHNGLVYTVTALSTVNEPTVSKDWKEAKKFNTDCYNDLYCLYLARYLAMCVTKNSITPIATPLTRHGVIVKKSLNFDGASHEDVTRLANWSSAEIQDCYDNMVEWVLSQTDTNCFDLFTPFVKTKEALNKTNECENDEWIWV